MKVVNCSNVSFCLATNVSGVTINSWAGIRLGEGTAEALHQVMATTAKQNWRGCKVLVIHEVGLLNCDLFDKLEKLARLVRGSDTFFGGIQVNLNSANRASQILTVSLLLSSSSSSSSSFHYLGSCSCCVFSCFYLETFSRCFVVVVCVSVTIILSFFIMSEYIIKMCCIVL